MSHCWTGTPGILPHVIDIIIGSSGESHLNISSVYTVLYVTSDGYRYGVINDQGGRGDYCKTRFIPIEQYIKNQIKEVIS